MERLTTNELVSINGGISKALIGGILIGIVFVASAIYGFINPNKCNNAK